MRALYFFRSLLLVLSAGVVGAVAIAADRGWCWWWCCCFVLFCCRCFCCCCCCRFVFGVLFVAVAVAAAVICCCFVFFVLFLAALSARCNSLPTCLPSAVVVVVAPRRGFHLPSCIGIP